MTAQLEPLTRVELTPAQREQMRHLMMQINTSRIVAENFIAYFAKEQGVNLSLYQFDGDALVFVPISFAPGPAPEQQQGEALPATVNGQHEL